MRLICLLLILCLIMPMFILAQGNPNDDRIYDAVRRKLAEGQPAIGHMVLEFFSPGIGLMVAVLLWRPQGLFGSKAPSR